ncbi:hypothetical protein HDU96_000986 [Phlyctochytrium bullatum]|nr:hypothetical protein HDU96_000986 [Phlyctochytrium bullatum]
MTYNAPSAFSAAVVKLPWKDIFQRVPGTWLIFMILFSTFGPAYAPYTFGAYYLLLHFMFMASNLRTAWGAYNVNIEARKASYIDWVQRFCDKTGAVDGFDTSVDMPIEHVMHVIILPNYKEDMETLCETLDILASHPRAPTNYKICLAMEETEAGSEEKARNLIRMYQEHFFEMNYAIHPANLPGEMRGKGSNVSWAAKHMARSSKDPSAEVMTVMDADTAFAADYFMSVAYHFAVANAEDRHVSMFAPTTVFDRNAKDTNWIVRHTDVMWSLGVISNMYPQSRVAFPCSAYSISMELAQAVGFWDAGPEGLGEDMHMYLKCFFATEGRIKIHYIYSPASCCNVEGPGMFGGLKARYDQAKRHLWGCLDTGYALRKTLLTHLAPGHELRVPPLRFRKGKTWADGVTVSDSAEKKGDEDVSGKRRRGGKPEDEDRIGFAFPSSLLANMFYRLLEAHLLVGHLFLLMGIVSLVVPGGNEPSGVSVAIWESITTESVHPFMVWILDLCGWIRFIGLIPVIFTVRYYEKYHHWVGIERWRLSALGSAQPTATVNGKAGLRVQPLGRRAQLVTQRSAWNFLDWAAVPFSGLFFHTIPMIVAQTSQLWTDRLDYKVAAKPTLNKKPEAPAAIEEKVGLVSAGASPSLVPTPVEKLRSNGSSPSRLSSTSDMFAMMDGSYGGSSAAAARRLDYDGAGGFEGVTVEDGPAYYNAHGSELPPSHYDHFHNLSSASPTSPATAAYPSSYPHTSHHHSSSVSSSISSATTAISSGHHHLHPSVSSGFQAPPLPSPSSMSSATVSEMGSPAASPSLSARWMMGAAEEALGAKPSGMGRAAAFLAGVVSGSVGGGAAVSNGAGIPLSTAQRSPSVASTSTSIASSGAATLAPPAGEDAFGSSFSVRGDSGFFEYDEQTVMQMGGAMPGAADAKGRRKPVMMDVPAHVVASAMVAQNGRSM